MSSSVLEGVRCSCVGGVTVRGAAPNFVQDEREKVRTTTRNASSAACLMNRNLRQKNYVFFAISSMIAVYKEFA